VKRWERWTFHAAAGAVAVTGFAYLWMKYFVQNPDPFAVVNHPWESAMLQLHVLASPLFILIFGIVFNSHVVKKLGIARLPNRKTGLWSLGLFAAMLASGYLLQVMTSAAVLRAMVVLHVGSGALFSATYVAHLVISARVARHRRPAGAPIPEVA
jgi:hypothetical protein